VTRVDAPPPAWAAPQRSFAHRVEFVRTHTALAPVPLVPEISVHQATELTPLWHATAADLRGWDESPFWAFPWAGGQALARLLLDSPSTVRGLSVLDFGTGGGVVAIAAARAGATRTFAWDIDPYCDAAVRLNAVANGVALDFRCGSPLGEDASGVDLVLAGDVFYERKLARDFLAWSRRLAARGCRVLAGDPGRIYSPAEGVAEIARYEVPTTTEIEDRPRMRTRVLEILP